MDEVNGLLMKVFWGNWTNVMQVDGSGVVVILLCSDARMMIFLATAGKFPESSAIFDSVL